MFIVQTVGMSQLVEMPGLGSEKNPGSVGDLRSIDWDSGSRNSQN